MHYSITFWVLAVVILCFTYANGFNDGCNAVATLIASRAMSPQKALAFAAIIEFLTPFSTLIIGSVVAETIKNIVNESVYTNPAAKSAALAFITAGIIAALVWNISNRVLGIPASSSHALIGGFIGAGVAAFGVMQISWQNVLTKVVLMIILTPVISFIVGFFIMKLTNYLFRYAGTSVNLFFKLGQIFNMSFLAFNHSFNDSQKSVGIIMMLMSVELGYTGSTPVWAITGVGLALALGIVFGGFRIIRTVGMGIYRVKPSNSFASQLTAGAIILTSSLVGAPVSASQIVSSSIMGVGSAERISAVRWSIVSRILFSWVFTLPAAALLGALLYCILRLVL